MVGEITLTYDRVEVAADPGQMLMLWTAEPGSKSAEALSLLGSWAASPRQPELRDAPDRPKHSAKHRGVSPYRAVDWRLP